MSRLKTTKAEREWAIAQYNVLCRMIDEGKWEYSKSKLHADCEAYKMFTWWEVHPVLTALFFLLCLPIGFIPAILFVLVAMIQKPARERYEVALGKLKHGKPFQAQSAPAPTSSTTEIGKLHELLKSGALTQDEFESEKKKILGKAS